MATENNAIKTKVTLDATQAQQEIVKLNAVAADGTKTLEERIAAKNKQTELQENLNKKTIAALEKEKKALTGVVGKEKELEKVTAKLNNTKVKQLKQETNLIKQSNGLSKALASQTGAVNKLDNATGGMITSLRALAANPIVLFVTLLAGAFKLLKEAFTSSEEGQNSWNKAMAVVQALLGNLLDLVADVAEGLVWLFTHPQEAMQEFADNLKKRVQTSIEGLLQLMPKLGEAISLVFAGKFKEAGKVATDALGKVALGVDSVTDSIGLAGEALNEFIKEQEKEAKLAADVADMRAKADKIERKLIVDRSIIEAKIAELRLKAKQEEKFGAAERKVFLNDALDLGNELLDQETLALELRRDAQVLENTFSRSNKENLTKEAEAIAAVNNQLTKRKNIERTIETEKKRVNGQIRTEAARAAKAEEAERNAAMKARQAEIKGFQSELEERERIQKESEQRKRDQKIADEDAERERLADVAQRDRDARNEIDALEIERRYENGEDTIQLELDLLVRKRDQELANFEGTALEKIAIEKEYGNAIDRLQQLQVEQRQQSDKEMLNSVIGMAGEAFGISKELAIAQALIAAPKAITEVWTKAAEKKTLPQIALHGIGGTAMVLAPIIKGLSSIKKSKMQGKAGGRSSGGGGGTISAPTGISSSAVGDLSANNAANINEDSGLNSSATAAAAAGVSGSSSSNIVFQEGQYNDFQDQVGFIEGQTNIN